MAARRYKVAYLPKTDANTLYFSARATNCRPYIIHATWYDKHQFEKSNFKKAFNG